MRFKIGAAIVLIILALGGCGRTESLKEQAVLEKLDQRDQAIAANEYERALIYLKRLVP